MAISNLLQPDSKFSPSPSRSEMLLGTTRPPYNNTALLADEEDEEDFKEEDIWESIKEVEESETASRNQKPPKQTVSARKIQPVDRRAVGLSRESGLSAALIADAGPGFSVTSLSSVRWNLNAFGSVASEFQRIPQGSSQYQEVLEAQKQVRHHQSAPLNVPDWSKILGSSVHKETRRGLDEVDMKEERLPPHEFVARHNARNSFAMYTSSVCEGAGRTLKGRDLKRVRNAVLRQTGFID